MPCKHINSVINGACAPFMLCFVSKETAYAGLLDAFAPTGSNLKNLKIKKGSGYKHLERYHTMNKVILVGRTVEAIELKKVGDNQKSTITTQLAVGRSYKDAEGNKETDFLTLVAWGKTAEVLASMTAKGSLVGIEGELRSRSYEKDGAKRYVTEVLVDKVDLLESKAQTEARAKAAQA